MRDMVCWIRTLYCRDFSSLGYFWTRRDPSTIFAISTLGGRCAFGLCIISFSFWCLSSSRYLCLPCDQQWPAFGLLLPSTCKTSSTMTLIPLVWAQLGPWQSRSNSISPGHSSYSSSKNAHSLSFYSPFSLCPCLSGSLSTFGGRRPDMFTNIHFRV